MVRPSMPRTRAEIETAVSETRRADLRAAIVEALTTSKGNRSEAARVLGYSSPSHLRRAATRVGLDLARLFPAPDPATMGVRGGRPKTTAKCA